jgi:serine/threonine protein kinase
MDDNLLSKNNGKFFTILKQDLGKGSYGDVLMGKNEYGKKLAIKCCKFDQTGIPNILEASIMKSIQHPNINHAIEIICSSSILYIIQDLAVTDLHQYTSLYKQNHSCSIDELNYIFSCLLQAVSILHHQNIIHCDIKASNVLMFHDNTIKLADFSLACVKSDELYNHTVCTSTHRSLECFLKQGFNESLDIWSLGCTFYEIAYQEFLFPNQNVDKINNTRKTIKNLLNYKSINAIIDWAKMTDQPINITHHNLPYSTINICKRFYDIEMNHINMVIKKMLIIDLYSREKAINLLNYFPTNQVNPKLLTNKRKELEYTEEARIIRYIQQMTENLKIQELAYQLYKQIDTDLSEYYKAIGCTWIAIKIISGSQPLIQSIELIHEDQLIEIEKIICLDLHFRIHVII